MANYNGEQLFAPPGPSSAPHITASLPSRKKCMLLGMVHDNYSMSCSFISEEFPSSENAKTHWLADTSLLLTLKSTGSEWKKDLNHQVDSATSGKPIKENSYYMSSDKIGTLK
jgi:hypothetical protein